jgi:putative transposase
MAPKRPRFESAWSPPRRRWRHVSAALAATYPETASALATTYPETAKLTPSMRSKPVAALLVDLTKTPSRPYVSDDNLYSAAQFKTLKYRPDFPAPA